MKRKTNFDRYLEKQLKDPDFASRYQKAGEAWNVALQLAALRKKAGLSQKELAQRVGTSQQQISRLESTSYEGHSLSMLRRVAEVLGAKVHIDIQLLKRPSKKVVLFMAKGQRKVEEKNLLNVSKKSQKKINGFSHICSSNIPTSPYLV
jgi:transcriptional regulator with XRE-family HTH domain